MSRDNKYAYVPPPPQTKKPNARNMIGETVGAGTGLAASVAGVFGASTSINK
jgi:hypothetical protein